MISCIIVEDELPAREELKYFLNEEKEIKLIAEFDNPLDTLNFLENNTTDVIFLDISMPDMNGISLGKIITKMKRLHSRLPRGMTGGFMQRAYPALM